MVLNGAVARLRDKDVAVYYKTLIRKTTKSISEYMNKLVQVTCEVELEACKNDSRHTDLHVEYVLVEGAVS
jgi:hypothetical protein